MLNAIFHLKKIILLLNFLKLLLIFPLPPLSCGPKWSCSLEALWETPDSNLRATTSSRVPILEPAHLREHPSLSQHIFASTHLCASTSSSHHIPELPNLRATTSSSNHLWASTSSSHHILKQWAHLSSHQIFEPAHLWASTSLSQHIFKPHHFRASSSSIQHFFFESTTSSRIYTIE